MNTYLVELISDLDEQVSIYVDLMMNPRLKL